MVGLCGRGLGTEEKARSWCMSVICSQSPATGVCSRLYGGWFERSGGPGAQAGPEVGVKMSSDREWRACARQTLRRSWNALLRGICQDELVNLAPPRLEKPKLRAEAEPPSYTLLVHAGVPGRALVSEAAGWPPPPAPATTPAAPAPAAAVPAHRAGVVRRPRVLDLQPH